MAGGLGPSSADGTAQASASQVQPLKVDELRTLKPYLQDLGQRLDALQSVIAQVEKRDLQHGGERAIREVVGDQDLPGYLQELSVRLNSLQPLLPRLEETIRGAA